MWPYVYMELFAFIGAVLGFLSLRNHEEDRKTQMILSVLTGMFAAAIVYTLLYEEMGRSHTVSLVISGGVAFGGTDAMISLYQNLKKRIEDKKD